MSSKESKKGSGLPEDEVATLHKKELARRKTHLENTQKQTEEERQQWAVKEKELRDEIVELQQTCNSKDAKICQLQSQLALCDNRDGALQTKVAELLQQLTESEKNATSLQKTIHERDQALSKLNDEMKKFKEDMCLKELEIDELSKALSRRLVDRLQAEAKLKAEVDEGMRQLADVVHQLQEKVMGSLALLEQEALKTKPGPDVISEMSNLSGRIDFETKEYLRTLHEVRLKTSSLADALLLAKVGKTLHSNLTVDVRHQLSMLDRDQLLILLDCLSYQDSVSAFLASELPLHSYKSAALASQEKPRPSSTCSASLANIPAPEPQDAPASSGAETDANM